MHERDRTRCLRIFHDQYQGLCARRNPRPGEWRRNARAIVGILVRNRTAWGDRIRAYGDALRHSSADQLLREGLAECVRPILVTRDTIDHVVSVVAYQQGAVLVPGEADGPAEVAERAAVLFLQEAGNEGCEAIEAA